MIGLEDIKRLDGINRIIASGGERFNKIGFDSRRIGPGDLFVAVRGGHTDGHRYIEEVIKKGASGICCEAIPEHPDPGITWIQVTNSAVMLGKLASLYYGDPSHKLLLTGVTGTNGKTTIATSLYSLFRALGHKAGLFSTTGICIDETVYKTSHTTPDPLTLHSYMAKMLEAGCDHVFMEVSSHAADQDRIAGLQFAGGIFTNLTQDHLDYHHDYKSYLYAKKKFFDHLPPEAFVLVNADDRNAQVMVQNTKAKVHTYGIKSPADFRARILESHLDGTLLAIDKQEVWVSFVGEFSASNMTAVYGTAVLLGADRTLVLEKMSALPPVAGRFEVFHSPEGVVGIVDYAHTPDAIGKVLKAIRQLRRGHEKVVTVMGAGGNRDRSKRPRMAKLAYELSDILILTSDNPRDEDPEEIIRNMLEGLTKEEQKKVISMTNRGEAIKTAVRLAAPGDIVLVAGKGHEDYQEIKGVRVHFDDREFLAEQLGPGNVYQPRK